MLKRIMSLVATLVLAVCCFGQTVSDARKTDIIESVYRYQIAHCYKDRSPETYFVSYERHDPDDALFARLASSGRRVMKRSQLRRFKNAETGRWSIVISVSDVNFQSQRIAYVRGTCMGGALDSYSYLYRLEFRWGRWIVMRRKLTGFA